MSAPNPMRGEAALGEHKLVIDFNSLCSLEAALGMNVPQIVLMMDRGLGFTEIRACVRVFADSDMTLEEAGNLCGDVGHEAAVDAITTAMQGFFAPKKDTKANPLKAA